MKATIIILLMITYAAFANIGISTGVGSSSYKVSVLNKQRITAQNEFVSLDINHELNESEYLSLSNVISNYRQGSRSILTEYELQTSFMKQLTTNNAFGIGFNFSLILNDNVPDTLFVGNGFGLNFKYVRTITKSIALNMQMISNNYIVAPASDTKNSSFSNQTFRLFLTFFPESGA